MAQEQAPQSYQLQSKQTDERKLKATLQYLVDSYGDETIEFANQNKISTIKELADTLIQQMDMIYHHIIQGIQSDGTNIQWIKAKNTFLNPTGWIDGGCSYGILLNGFDTAVSGSDSPAVVHGFIFETIDWLYCGAYDENTGYYFGNAYTDILFASHIFFKQDFCPLDPLFHSDGLEQRAFNDGINLFSSEINLNFACGSDIQSYSAKGAIGIRIDGIDNFSIENVYTNNIINWGDLCSDKCGEYEKITFKGGDVDKDIQCDYTGTKVHGTLTNYASGEIMNVKIENLKALQI